MGTPGRGYALDPAELDRLKATLESAGEALGLRDFRTKAGLGGSLTVQSVSPHENVEETVDEVVRALTKFVDQDYARTVRVVQDFIDRVHTAIGTAVDGVHRTQQEYLAAEQSVGDGLRRVHPG